MYGWRECEAHTLTCMNIERVTVYSGKKEKNMCTCDVCAVAAAAAANRKKIQSAVVQITILDSFLSEVFWSDSISITIR